MCSEIEKTYSEIKISSSYTQLEYMVLNFLRLYRRGLIALPYLGTAGVLPGRFKHNLSSKGGLASVSPQSFPNMCGDCVLFIGG